MAALHSDTLPAEKRNAMSTSVVPPKATLTNVRRAALEPFFAPESIALIGACAKEGSVGRTLLENLGAFEGSLYPVNPNHARVLLKPAFGRIGDVPGTVDLAVIATPAQTVAGIVRECANVRRSAPLRVERSGCE